MRRWPRSASGVADNPDGEGTIRVDDPNLWLHLQRTFDPLLFGGFDSSE